MGDPRRGSTMSSHMRSCCPLLPVELFANTVSFSPPAVVTVTDAFLAVALT